jgi:hypothetical protein
MTVAPSHDAAPFLNRELSWLAFNERVFEQAAEPSTPLLERVKFATIVASNLDEFFMVRVAGLKQADADGDTSADPAGLTPALQLAAIRIRAHALVAELYRVTNQDLLPSLAAAGIRVLRLRRSMAPGARGSTPSSPGRYCRSSRRWPWTRRARFRCSRHSASTWLSCSSRPETTPSRGWRSCRCRRGCLASCGVQEATDRPSCCSKT